MNNPDDWGFALTPVAYRIRDRAAKLTHAEALRRGDAAPVAQRSDEAMIDQIAALMTGDAFVSNANLPNRGQITGLPTGAIVETNAIFSGLGVQAIHAGRLPPALEPIVTDHAERQSALLSAVLGGHHAALFPLFRSDPLLRHLPVDDVRTMFNAMLAATAEWLPETLKGVA